MADDDDQQIKHTLESLFAIYANYKLNPLDLDNEIYDAILLSQIDFWLEEAKLLRSEFSTTDTGMAYMRYKKWRLDYDEFIELLEVLCLQKGIEFEDVKDTLIKVGPPTVGAEIVNVK